MRQAIHIFRKDVRQFRVAIGILLALTIVFALAAAQPWSHISATLIVGGLTTSGNLGSVLVDSGGGIELEPFLVLLWCYLIAKAIHADALPDDRQFWLTRPYDRRSLWAAKAIFVAAVINLPILLGQAWIVTRDGFPLMPNLPGLLWEQVLLTLVLTLPIAALAAVTAKLSHLVLAAVVTWAAAAVIARLSAYWGGLAWLGYSVALVAALGVSSTVLFLQFMRRKTMVSRAVMVIAGVAGLASVPFVRREPVLAIQARLAGQASGSPQMELGLPHPVPAPRSDASGLIYLEFQTTGVTAGTPIVCEAAEVTLETPSHAIWRSGVIGLNSAGSQAPDGCRVAADVNRAFFESAVDQKVRIRTVVYFTVFGDEHDVSIPRGGAAVTVPGVGACAVLANEAHRALLWCRSAFRPPSVLLRYLSDDGRNTPMWNPVSYSPFPAQLRLGPVGDDFSAVATTAYGAVIIKTARPVAHVRTEVDVPDVRLGDFQSGFGGKG